MSDDKKTNHLVYTGPPGGVPFQAALVEGASEVHAAIAEIAERLGLDPSQSLTAATLALARVCSETKQGSIPPAVFGKAAVMAFEGELKRLLEAVPS